MTKAQIARELLEFEILTRKGQSMHNRLNYLGIPPEFEEHEYVKHLRDIGDGKETYVPAFLKARADFRKVTIKIRKSS